MTAGLNLQIKIWRITNAEDDIVGGAVTTGTVIGYCPARMQAQPTEMLLLQQGLETERFFRLTVNPGTIAIKENDEFEISQPLDHPYYGERFRIVTMRYSDLNPRDPRNYIMLEASRSVRSHSEQ